MIIKTGVFATDEQLQHLAELAKQARETPVTLVGGYDLANKAWERAKKACHKAALENGLPDIPEYYGISQTGEFVRIE